MIKKFKPKPRLFCWYKKFVWWPWFFEYEGDTYFVFMNYVEVRCWYGYTGDYFHTNYRPIQE